MSGDLRFEPPRSREEALADDPLGKFHVWWFDFDARHVEDFRRVLDAAEDERPLQRHIANEPMLVAQLLRGGHGRWVLPERSLGGRYRPDFLIGERDSGGQRWTAIELESPRKRLTTVTGDPTAALIHGVRQILDWRLWLTWNLDTAVRSRSREGLGLEGITPSLPGIVVMGRRHELDPERQGFRRALEDHLNIEIMTYDRLVQRAASNLDGRRPRRGVDAG